MKQLILIGLSLAITGCGITGRKPIVQVEGNKRVAINNTDDSEEIWRLAGYDEHIVIVERAEEAARSKELELARMEADRELEREAQKRLNDEKTRQLLELRETERLRSIEEWERSELQQKQVFYFDSGRYNLSIDIDKKNNILELIDRSIAIDIRGRTDGVGSDEKNDQLALKRAVAAKQYLMNLGVEEQLISLNYSAENNYIASESNTSARAKNRRVEIEFILESIATTISKRNLN